MLALLQFLSSVRLSFRYLRSRVAHSTLARAHLLAGLEESIREGKTGYCPAAGIPALRKALADGIGQQRGGACTMSFATLLSVAIQLSINRKM